MLPKPPGRFEAKYNLSPSMLIAGCWLSNSGELKGRATGSVQTPPTFFEAYNPILRVLSLASFCLPSTTLFLEKYTVSAVLSKHTGPSWFREVISFEKGSGAE